MGRLWSWLRELRAFLLQMLAADESPHCLPPLEKNKTVHVWPPSWPEFKGGELEKIPAGLREREEVYGQPNVSISTGNRFKVSRAFAKNLGTIPAHTFTQYSNRIYCHLLVHPYVKEAMRRAFEVCPLWRPRKIGCFNPRRMRHSKNPRVPLSDHTWAIAFDIDPKQNRAWSRKKHPDRPQPFTENWSDFSDIPEGVILAWESVGFEWGGRWKTFCDPMHFSLRKVK